MLRFIIILFLLPAQTALASDWDPMCNAEVYDRADWIVVGALQDKQESSTWTITVEETIKGHPPKSFSIPTNRWLFNHVKDGQRYLFAVSTVDKPHLFHFECLRGAVQGKAEMVATKKLVDDPAVAILDSTRTLDADVAYIIGQRYAPPMSNPGRQPVLRVQALNYLRRCLEGDDAEVQLEALKAVRRMGDRSLEADIIKRLNEKTPIDKIIYLIRPMIGYLEEGGTEAGRKHLENLLQRCASDYPKTFQFADPCAEALGRIGHPDSVPILESAAEHGVSGAISALSLVGTMGSFDTLYKTYVSSKKPNLRSLTMCWLIRRSNRPVEQWMDPGDANEDHAATKSKWTQWYAKHREGMKIVRDFQSARGEWEQERTSP